MVIILFSCKYLRKEQELLYVGLYLEIYRAVNHFVDMKFLVKICLSV